MMKRTLCLLFVLALIAQIAAFPADKAEEEAEADADQAVAEGKKKAGDATAEAERIANAAKTAGKRKADDAEDVADAADKPKKNGHAHPHGHPQGHPHGHPRPPTHGKDCHKPGGQHSKVVDKVTNFEKKLENVAKDFLGIFMP